MIEISFAFGQCAIIVALIVFRMAAYIKKRKINWKFEAKQVFFLVNLLVIYRFNFHPFSKVDGQVQPLLFDIATAWPFRMTLVPFVNLMDYEIKREMLVNIIGNFAMFIPTGIMTPLIYKDTNSLKKVVLTGFLISLIIEIIQLPFAVRASDVDDLILNTLGCLLGYGILSLARAITRKVRKA